MRRVLVVALGLAAGCGETKPTEKPPPPASEMFDKTEKDLKAPKGMKEKKSSGFG
jgi:hypothetical protein